MPRRYLSPSVSRDQLLAEVANQEPRAALFYLMALPHAADDCALPTNTASELRLLVCPGLEGVTRQDVAEWIRLLTTCTAEDGHTLLEYGDDGRLRYPPRAFYRYQTYVPADKRGEATLPAPGNERSHAAPVPAQHPGAATPPLEGRPAAQIADISEKLRRQERSADTGEKSLARARPSVTVTVTPSPTPSSPPSRPPPSEGELAPDAIAPDAPGQSPASPLLLPTAKTSATQQGAALARQQREPDVIFDALLGIFAGGDASLLSDAERAKWNVAAKGFRTLAARTKRSPPEMAALIGQAHQHWPNVKGDLPESPNGLLSNFAALLRGPQVGGRSNGTVDQHTRRLIETASVNRGPPRGSAALQDDWRLSDHGHGGQ